MKARDDLEAKLQHGASRGGDGLRLGGVEDGGAGLGGRVHAELGAAEVRGGCKDEDERDDGRERESSPIQPNCFHLPPDAMVSFTLDSSSSLEPRPAVTSITFPVLST